MSDLKINGKAQNDLQIVKLRKDQEAAALATAKANGTDDVFFKVGEDTFVASGRGVLRQEKFLNILKVDKSKVSVEFNGKQAEVVDVDNQANDRYECAQWPITGGLIATTGGTYLASQLLRISSKNFKALGLLWAGAQGALALGAYMFGPFRTMKHDMLQKHGEVVQKNTENPGGLGNAFKTGFGFIK